MRILVVNSGSSSLKLRHLHSDDTMIGSWDLEPIALDGTAHRELGDILAGLEGVDAVGHRVVHGGRRYSAGVRIDPKVMAELHALVHLAPLHQPRSLAGIDSVTAALPAVPLVACFDTAFHATIPAEASTYAIPADWRNHLGIKRFGFHGLSHSYAARRAREMTGRDDVGIVTCHLGAGASLTAVRGDTSVDTTMGFTPLEGLVMATRSGNIDPGALLWLQRTVGLSADELAEALEHHSGLKALAGTADMKAILDAVDDADANLALAVYVHRLIGAIAAMAATLGGLDVLVFTGGVGENAPGIRARAASRLRFLGVSIDPDRNAAANSDADITERGAPVTTLVVRAREDLEIAGEVRRVLT